LRWRPKKRGCAAFFGDSYHEGMRSVLLFFLSTLAIAGEYTTYIGDAYPRSVAAIATDVAGNTYVAGNRRLPVNP
jgi:hypothetical protein